MHNIDNEQLRERVDQTVKRQKKFMNVVLFTVNLCMFILFAILAIVMLNGADLPPELVQGRNAPVAGAFILLGMGWLTSLFFHGMSMVAELGWLDRSMRDKIVAQEVGRQLYEQAASSYEKPKRRLEEESPQYAISVDGELIEVDEEQPQKAVRN